MIRDGSKTFYMASLLLPQRICDAARSLYGFCRVADDSWTNPRTAPPPLSACSRARPHLSRHARPSPPTAPMPMWLARFAIPRALPEALIEGFAWDASGKRYETLSE
jgi:15-cis-phytoene synthase